MIPIRLPNFLKALLLSASLFFLALLYGRSNFYRDPGSVFYDRSRAFETRYSDHRASEATAYFDNITASLQNAGNEKVQGGFMKAGTEPRICLTFLTTARKTKKQYLDLAVSSALVGLSAEERVDLDVKIFFADTDPTLHPSWKSILANISDETYSSLNNVPTAQFSQLVTLEREEKFESKGGIDYATALKHCYVTSAAPYIAIFEDDILVANSWLSRTLLALRDVEEQMAERSWKEDRWLYLRLFNEEGASGWGSRALFGNNTPLISLLIALPLAGILVFFRNYRRGGRLNIILGRYLGNAMIFVVCGVTVPAFVILFYQAGKVSMLPPWPGVKIQNFGCCAQAMVFPRRSVLELAEYLLQSAEMRKPYDMAMDEYAAEKGLERFALYPVMAQHVGKKSKMNPGRAVENRVWSMSFESLSAKKMSADHESMIKQVYIS